MSTNPASATPGASAPRRPAAGEGSTWQTRAYAALYFAAQRLRGGVDPTMIAAAGRLLDADPETRHAHTVQRLATTHGAPAGALEWLRWQPLCDGPGVRERFAAVQKVGGARASGRYEIRRTSGSTGIPVFLAKDRAMTAQMDAVMWAVYAWHGIGPGDAHARFWGRPISRSARWRKRLLDAVMHRERFDAFNLSPERVTAFFCELRRLRPSYAYGYPSLIRYFAERCAAMGLDGTTLALRVVVTTGELLRPDTRAFIERFFHCRVVDEYGCTEAGVLGFECEAGTMHSIPVAAYPEVVRPDGSPADAGETGEVVATDLHGRTMPLLRYRLTDRGAWGEAGCACGRSLPRLQIGSGRIDSFIQTPRGHVYDAILAYAMPPGVERFRAYQTAPDALRIELVPGIGYHDEETPRDFRRRVDGVLAGMSITIDTVQAIPADASGKLRYFVPLPASERPSES